MIREEWRGWLENGPAVLVASSAEDGTPDCTRGVSLLMEDASTLRITFSRESAQHLVQNLAARAWVAVTVTKIDDYTSLQFKGEAAMVPVTDDDRRATADYRDKFVAACAQVWAQSPVKSYLKLRTEPDLCMRVVIREAYNQTPGRGAGSAVAR